MSREENRMEYNQDKQKEEQFSNDQLSIKMIDNNSTGVSIWNKSLNSSSSYLSDTFWNNLIFVELDFYIENFHFEEEFLWDRKRRDPNGIKQFAVELVKEKVVDQSKCCLMKELKSFTFELLDLTADHITKKISNEVYFYEHFRPYDLIKSGLLGLGIGIDQSEHLICINLDLKIKEECYQESFTWNILDHSLSPEDFAIHTVNEIPLSKEFIFKISNGIRKEIKNYVFKLFEFVSKKQQLMINEYSIKSTKSINKRLEKKSTVEDGYYSNMKNNTYLYDNKLSTLLGNKTHRKVDDDSLPVFLLGKPDPVDRIDYSDEKADYSIEKELSVKFEDEKKDANNPNILYYDYNKIIISKSIFKKDDLLTEPNETNYFEIMYHKDSKETNSNRSQTETKSTSPKSKPIGLNINLSNEDLTSAK